MPKAQDDERLAPLKGAPRRRGRIPTHAPDQSPQDLFAALGVPLLVARDFTDADAGVHQ
jgi:hypothetical protein